MKTEPVVVATAQGPAAAAQLRAYLEANGVPSEARGAAVPTVHPFTVDGLGLLEILVAPEFEERAMEVMARVESGELALEDDEDPSPDASVK